MKMSKLLLALCLTLSACCEEREDFKNILIDKQKLQKQSGEAVGFLLSFKSKDNTVQKAKCFEKWGNDIQIGDFVKGEYNCGEIKLSGFEPRPKN
jgi:hypothetical protein